MFSYSIDALLGLALFAASCALPPAPKPLALDFGKGGVTDWRSLNDDVMGGRSRCSVDYSRSSLTWEGRVSLENNGGFSSVRSPWGNTDLSAFSSVTMRCRTTNGDPDAFTLTMETSRQWWMPYWKANFKVDGEWTEVTLPFDAMKKSSAMTGELPKLWTWGDLSDILRIGLMKYDGQAGPFGLEIDWIRFDGPEEIRN